MHDPLCRLTDSPCARGETEHTLMDTMANGLVVLRDPICGKCMDVCTCRSLHLARLQGPIGSKHAGICWCSNCLLIDKEKGAAIRAARRDERQKIADAIHGLPHDDCSDDYGCREWGNMDRILAGEAYTINDGTTVLES